MPRHLLLSTFSTLKLNLPLLINLNFSSFFTKFLFSALCSKRFHDTPLIGSRQAKVMVTEKKIITIRFPNNTVDQFLIGSEQIIEVRVSQDASKSVPHLRINPFFT
jgi:hypothetical protein